MHAHAGNLFLRRFIDFDPDEGMGDAPTGEAVATEPDEPAAEPADDWRPSRQEWEASQEQLQQLRYYFDQAAAMPDDEPQQQQPDPGQPFEFDPYDPNQLAQLIQVAGAQAAERAIAPIMQQQQQAQVTAWVDDQAAKLPDIAGELTNESVALIKQAAMGVAGDEVAFRGIAKQIAAIERAAEIRGAEKSKKAAEGGGSTPYEPGAGATGVPGEPPAKSAEDAAKRWVASQRARPVS